ncbi:MAG TPA: hypothetical protein VGJ36_10545 [Gemmatimonadales bacterium]|jgi:hypothetical protein
MTEQPRNWDKELADIDRAMAKQPGSPAGIPVAGGPPPRRRFVALAWFWAVLAIVLAVALLVWPYDKSCGLRLIFFLGAALLAGLMGVLGAFAGWSHRQGLALVLSLLVILWAGLMAAREILPRAGYAKAAREWTCPPPPPVPNPAPSPAQ